MTVIQAEMLTGDYVERNSITVEQWLAQYLELYRKPNVKLSTYVYYLITAEHLSPLYDIQLQKLTPNKVQAFYNKLSGSQSLLTKIHNLLKSAYTKAFQLEIVKKNIMLLVTPPKGTPPKSIEVFSKEEIELILDFVKNSWQHKNRYYPIIMCAIETGMRLGEILALRKCDVHKYKIQVRKSITVIGTRIIEQTPKTDSSVRDITISKELYDIIMPKDDGQIDPTGLVFSTRDGKHIQPRLIERTWVSILSNAGVGYKKFHCLRHTLATTLMANGVAPNDVAARLGHHRASTTMDMYGHAMPGVAEKLPELIHNSLGIKRKSIE